MKERYVRTGAGHARIDGETAMLLDGPPWLGGRDTGGEATLDASSLLCPVTPTKIVCVGKNYRLHAREMSSDVPKQPLLFFKPPSSLLASGGTVVLPPESERVDYEGELAVVIGKSGRRIPSRQSFEHVFGFAVLCDVTARDLQKKDGQWTRAKGFDTFCPVGHEVVRGIDPAALGIRVTVNGETRQDGNTRDMVYDIADLVSYISAAMTLEAGDVIATGTPHGVGPLAAGDRVVVAIDDVGSLEFDVSTERA